MNTLKNCAAAAVFSIPTTSVNWQEITIPEILEVIPWDVQLILQELPLGELSFSGYWESSSTFISNSEREIGYNFTVLWRDLRVSYGHGVSGWNFSNSFYFDQKFIPPQIVIPQDINIPDFYLQWNIFGRFQYDYQSLELAAQIREWKNCEIWWGVWVTEYSFEVVTQIDATWESLWTNYDIEWTFTADWKETLYNPFLTTDIHCDFPTWNDWNVLLDSNFHFEVWNASVELRAGYQYQFSPQFALWVWVGIQYHDYYEDLEVFSNFSDGWWDINPHVTFQIDNKRSSIIWIITDDTAHINVEIFF